MPVSYSIIDRPPTETRGDWLHVGNDGAGLTGPEYRVRDGRGTPSALLIGQQGATVDGTLTVTGAVTLHLDWGNLLHTPTTLDGYGITDAASAGHAHAEVYAPVDHAHDGYALADLGNVSTASFILKFTESGLSSGGGGGGGGGDVPLATTAPAALGETAAAGASLAAARGDHVHQRPTPAEIGAAPADHAHAYAPLVEGRVPLANLPDQTGRKLVVANEAARLAITAGGDMVIAIQSDTGVAYGINPGADPSVAANWSPLGAPSTHGHAASAIILAPTGTMVSTTLQSAITELASGKAAADHLHDFRYARVTHGHSGYTTLPLTRANGTVTNFPSFPVVI